MRRKRIPMWNYSPSKQDRFVFDTNILIRLFHPVDYSSKNEVCEELYASILREKISCCCHLFRYPNISTNAFVCNLTYINKTIRMQVIISSNRITGTHETTKTAWKQFWEQSVQIYFLTLQQYRMVLMQ